MIVTFIHWVRRGGGLLFAPLLTNSDERCVRSYVLPELRSDTLEAWKKEKETVRAFFDHKVYGTMPKEKPQASVKILEEGEAFGDSAVRKQIALTLSRAGKSLTLQLLMYLPKKTPPRQTLLAYNLEGNHTVIDDQAVIPSTVYAKRLPGVVRRFKERDRGRKIKKEHLPIERLVKKGVAVITLYYGDVDPDYDDGFENGAHALYPELTPGSWGSISAWAWGLSRVMDYLETDTTNNRGIPAASIDQTRVALFGFSRLGKAALWAAANDERFAAVIAASSGKGGASLTRRNFGETIFLMTFRFPHWFMRSYGSFAGNEHDLSIDQHQLLALIAPRPVLVSSADKDWWSDPKGEQAAVKAAQGVYGFYKSNGPQHVLHHGQHAVTKDEWADYLDFLNKEL